ncbi:MAG: PEGA domain-containing protein [Myxococcales bacterium]|nr:PEGA domain-containing protein [Myxococcales bacterium]
MRSLGSLAVLVTFATVLGVTPRSWAQPADEGDAVGHDLPAEAPPDEEVARQEARERFMRGVALFEEGALDGALAEFRASRKRFATRVATRNEAICLRELGRYDEALDVFEALLRDFDDMSPEWRQMVQRDRQEVERRVGEVILEVNEPGATVVLSGRTRGTTPIAGPLRVSSGSHPLRIDKPGFAPYQTRVEVAGQERATLHVELQPLRRAGTLRVSDTGGRGATVYVDRTPMGPAPWSGRVSPGRHTVVLLGEGDLATPPANVVVSEGATADLALSLADLPATLRIEPQPLGAEVALDGVALGQGVWEGRVEQGMHRIEVASPGFLTRAIDLPVGEAGITKSRVVLERDPTSEAWQIKHPPRVAIDLALGFALGPSLGGELDDCSDCGRDPVLGGRASLRVGYQLGIGLGFFADVGYLGLYQRVRARPAQLVGVTGAEAERDGGTLREELMLQGLMVGGALAYAHAFGDLSLHGRLGGGGLFGSVATRRRGELQTSAGTPYAIGPYVETATAHFVTVTPELRFDYRVHPRVALGAGLSALVAIDLREPRWRDDRLVPSPTPFLGTLNPIGRQLRTVGHFLVVIPDVGMRVDF